MKNLFSILIVLFIVQAGFGQDDDSTIINRVNDNYIEIQSLRYTLFKWTNTANGAIKESFIPQPITLKNGVVFIKDRINKPIAFYVFSNSCITQYDYFSEGKLSSQSINFSDSTGIDKYYWENGNLKNITYIYDNQKKIYNYTKEGALIELNDDYSELIRNADNYPT
jgi:hypothetical protein